jgi:hypothetical protein
MRQFADRRAGRGRAPATRGKRVDPDAGGGRVSHIFEPERPMTFQIQALPADPFRALFALDDAALHARNACREVVRESPGTPCRVSLEDARVGETVLLVNHCHLPAQSPYRSSHAIYVRHGVARARPGVGAVPASIATRLISVRLFDAADMMVGADVVAGTGLNRVLTDALRDDAVGYVHLHYARPGCFAASVTRPG